MERLTYRPKDPYISKSSGDLIEAYSDADIRGIINRLAAYEDTGLTPQACAEAREAGKVLSSCDYDRLSRLAEKWGETYDVYFPAMQSTEESDVYQEKLDRATRSYIGDNQFYPFAERYPEIKQLGYGPRRTK